MAQNNFTFEKLHTSHKPKIVGTADLVDVEGKGTRVRRVALYKSGKA